MTQHTPKREPLSQTTVSAKLPQSLDSFLDKVTARINEHADIPKGHLIKYMLHQAMQEIGYTPPKDYAPPVSKILVKMLKDFKKIDPNNLKAILFC